jgi:uncharacterized protein
VTGPEAADPFLLPVAGLLTEPVGTVRVIDVADATVPLPDDLRLAAPIVGRIRLTHERRGILADVALTTSLAGECARCLRPLTTEIAIAFAEEYLPSIDLGTGRAIDRTLEPDALRLTDHHEVDLETSVADAIALAEPIAPLDRPDCPGLCIVCGLPLDEGAHDHPDDDIDPRLEALRGFVPADGAS